jgi:hypothetical protein
MPFDNTPAEIDTPASRLIEAAIRLIEQPEHWGRGASSIERPTGVAYCAWGAVREAADRMGAYGFLPAETALEAAAKARGYWCTTAMNDHARTTHATVLEVMREAAEIARGWS